MGVSSVILALALALYVAPAPTAAAAAAGTRRAQVTQLTVDVAFLKTQLTSTLAELNATKQTLAVETSRALMTDAHFSSMFDQAASTYLSQSSASIYVTSAAAAATYGTLPTVVACPENSNGANVPAGCTCNVGFTGVIFSSTATPFFTGTCTAVVCPSNSAGTAPSCTCNAGFTGSVTAIVGGFASTCESATCPTGSAFANGATCVCMPGYNGTITASVNGFTGTCTAVACPANSAGTDVPSGCTCDIDFVGQITPTSMSPFFAGACSEGGIVATGIITTWSGLAVAIPIGWLLCDGTSGTPDLRGRFVYGGQSGTENQSGGASTVTLAVPNMPVHSHSATSNFTGSNTGAHTHGLTDPGHDHLFFGDDTTEGVGDYTRRSTVPYDANTNGSGNGGNFFTKNTGNTKTGQMTGITMASASPGAPVGTVASSIGNAGSGTAFAVMPPYYTLCYIMKA